MRTSRTVPLWLVMALAACGAANAAQPPPAPTEGIAVAPLVSASPSLSPSPPSPLPVRVSMPDAPEPIAFSDEIAVLLDPRTSKAPGPAIASTKIAADIQKLEAALKGLPVTNPMRAEALFLVAMKYDELARTSGRERAEAEASRNAMRATDAVEAGRHDEITRRRRATEVAARKAMVQNLTTIAKDHDGSSGPMFPKLGAALYFLALEHAGAGDKDSSRRTFLSLVQKTPDSSFVAATYFQFGEGFRVDAESDPSKYAIALQAYAKASEFTGPLQPFSILREGQMHERMKDEAKARTRYRKVLSAHPESPAAKEVPAWVKGEVSRP